MLQTEILTRSRFYFLNLVKLFVFRTRFGSKIENYEIFHMIFHYTFFEDVVAF